MTPEQHDHRQAMITATFVALTAFAVLCVLLSAVGAAEYSVTVEPSAYVVTVETAKPPAKAKPEIWTFYAPFHCPPCVTQKADLKAWKDAPFTFRIGDINNAPVVIESYPTTAWQVDGKWWSYSGWHGTEHLEREWKRSQSTKAKPGDQHSSRGTHQSQSLSGTTRYTWPGDLRHHLRTTHGITESLTHEQAVMVHDAIHSGYSVNQIRSWARSRGYIK